MIERWIDFLNFRTCVFLRYTRQFSRQQLQPWFDKVEHVSQQEPAFEVTQSGVPYRQFCKQSMYLYKAAQQYLAGGVTEAAVMNVVLMVVLFRGWFNRMDRFQEFVQGIGGLDAASFSSKTAGRVAEGMAEKYRGEAENRRSAAYRAAFHEFGGEGTCTHCNNHIVWRFPQSHLRGLVF